MTTESDNIESQAEGSGKMTESPGELLKVARERRGFSEKQVADQLHITMHYVRAIETDTYEKLPGHIFARGYIKSYALLLGLDADRIVGLFNDQAGDQARSPQARNAELQAGRRGDRKWWLPWLLVAALAFACGYLVFWAYNRFFIDSGDESIVLVRHDAGDEPGRAGQSDVASATAVATGLDRHNAAPNRDIAPVNEKNREDVILVFPVSL